MDSNDSDLGTVYAVIFMVRSVVGSIMTAVFLAILAGKTPTAIQRHVPSAAREGGLPNTSMPDLFNAISAGTSNALRNVPGMTQTIEQGISNALSDAYSDAYAYIYYAMIAVGAIGLIACICIKDYDVLYTDHIPRRIYTAKRDVFPPDKGIISGDEEKDQSSVKYWLPHSDS